MAAANPDFNIQELIEAALSQEQADQANA